MSNAKQDGSLLFPYDHLLAGAGLADIIRSSISSGLIPAAAGREQAWAEAFLDWYRNPEGDFTVVTRDGRTCGLSVQPTSDDEMFLVLTDITALSEQAAMARESSQRLIDFAETAADWMWEIDAKANFTLISPQRDSALPIVSMLGRNFGDFAANIPDQTERKFLATEIAERRAFRDVRLQLQLEGQIWNLSLSGKLIVGENGQYSGHRGTFRDVTEEVLAATQLRDAKERAESASRSKTDFLAHMSHELRTPLNAILGFSEIMTLGIHGKIEQPEYLDYVQTIHESGAHLLAIINDILDISRIESGNGEVHEQAIDVYELIESCRRMMEERASAAGHVIDSRVPSDIPDLWGDGRAVKQILINLLGNAIKFTPPGGLISLGAGVTAQETIRLWVSDNGPGICEADQARVLIPFDRGSAMTRGESDGAGLGLPLSRMLTELHGGRLLLASEVGKGTTITIEFPQDRTIMEKISASAG